MLFTLRHGLRRHLWPLILTIGVLLFLWLPPLLFYGNAFGQALTKEPSLFLLALPVEPLSRYLFTNTVVLAALTSILAVLCGVPAGVVMARGKRKMGGALALLCVLPLTLPPIMLTFAWLQISRTPPAALMAAYAATSPATGNPVWRASLLLALCYYPVVGFALSAALRSIPSELEDAARLQGGTFAVWSRILFPLAAPALLGAAGLVSALAMWEMGAPDLLDVRTYSVEIYRNLSAGDGLHESDKFVQAALSSLPMLALGALFLWPALRALRLYAGRAIVFTPSHADSARKASPLLAWVCVPLVLLSPIGPLALFVFDLRPFIVLWEAWVDNNEEIINTLVLSSGAALLMTVLAFALASGWRNWSARARSTALLLNLIPFFISPILVGLALIHFYNRPLFAAVYGGLEPTGWPLQDAVQDGLVRYGMEIIGYIVRFLPLGVLLLVEAVRRIDPSLMEAAQSLGAAPSRVGRTVLAPMLVPALIGTFIMLWTLCGSELSTSVLVQQPGGQPLTIPLFQNMHIFNLPTVAALCLTLAGMGGIVFALMAMALKWWNRS